MAYLGAEGEFVRERRRRSHRRPPELIAAERDMGWLVGSHALAEDSEGESKLGQAHRKYLLGLGPLQYP